MNKMSLLIFCCWFSVHSPAQEIKRLDGTLTDTGRMNKRIRQLLEETRTPGISLAIIEKGKTVYLQSLGTANAVTGERLTNESLFVGASFSKPIFSTVILKLIKAGRLALDTPLVNYLPRPLQEYNFPAGRGYADLAGDPRLNQLTARMCLSHTTGLPNWRWIEDDGKLKFLFDPGTRYRYSGEGMYFLQFVTEQRLQKEFNSIAKEWVLDPAGMQKSTFIWTDELASLSCDGHDSTGTPYTRRQNFRQSNAAGSLQTSIREMSLFYRALLNGELLPEEYQAQMLSRQVRINSARQFGPLSGMQTDEFRKIGLGYGLGVGLINTPRGQAFFKEANDKGWRHYAIAFPLEKSAVIIMTNGDNGEKIIRQVLEDLLADHWTPFKWLGYP